MKTATAPSQPVALHQWWKCDACGRTLGEIVDQRVVIKFGDRRLSLPVVPGLDQTCPKCGKQNYLNAA